MPVVMRYKGYEFYFYASDKNEPPHIHVDYSDKTAKFWLQPVRLEDYYGFKAHELRRLESIIGQYEAYLLSRWNEFFN